ncbi:MAG: hypothetical protein WAN72_08000 [Candidatus Acidiferrales bacterium]
MRARLAALCARKAGHRKNVGVDNPTNIYMGFALVLMVLAGTSVAYSLNWDWRIQQKQQAKKIIGQRKFFSRLSTGPFAPVLVYLLNPFPWPRPSRHRGSDMRSPSIVKPLHPSPEQREAPGDEFLQAEGISSKAGGGDFDV